MCKAAITYEYVTKKVKRVWSFISSDVQSTNELQCSIQPEQNFVPSRHVTLNDFFSSRTTDDSAMWLRPSLPRYYLIIHAFTLSFFVYLIYFKIPNFLFVLCCTSIFQNFPILTMFFLLFRFSKIIYFYKSALLFRFHSG